MHTNIIGLSEIAKLKIIREGQLIVWIASNSSVNSGKKRNEEWGKK